MLSPLNTDADREYTRSRNIAFNEILRKVTAEYKQDDPYHYYYYAGATFSYSFVENQVSDIDCFHPSARGQKDLSKLTWDVGPFNAWQK
jgi:hypothetical protein